MFGSISCTGRLMGLVALVLILVFAFNGTIRDGLCDAAPQGVRDSVACGDRFRSVSQADAASLADRYLTRASGPNPDTALQLLTASGLDSRDRAAFTSRWEPALWAEASRVRPAGAFNSFEVEYTLYARAGSPTADALPGRIERRRVVLALRQTSEGVALQDEGADDLLASRDAPFPRLRLRQASTLQTAPRLDGSRGSAGRLRGSSVFAALCQIRRPQATAGALRDDSGWWIRAERGWIQTRRLAGPAGRRPGVAICAPRSLRMSGRDV